MYNLYDIIGLFIIKQKKERKKDTLLTKYNVTKLSKLFRSYQMLSIFHFKKTIVIQEEKRKKRNEIEW